MPFVKKPYKPKGKVPHPATVTFPSLHEDVEKALAHSFISPEPWFNHHGRVHKVLQEYSTHVMGRFECRNPGCSKAGWGSKRIGIVIRQFPNNGYSADVYKQRCKACNNLGVLRLDENSYVERVVYRLKKWAGIATEAPEYKESRGPPHESSLCEACRAGYCQETSN